MDRLTEWNKDHTHGQLLKGDGITRLCEYEDTGLTPDSIKENDEILKSYRRVCGGKNPDKIESLLDAEEAGLMPRLPCEPHTFVYYYDSEGMLDQAKYLSSYIDSIIKEIPKLNPITHILYKGSNPFNMILTDNVFLTKEEAEAALEAMKE